MQLEGHKVSGTYYKSVLPLPHWCFVLHDQQVYSTLQWRRLLTKNSTASRSRGAFCHLARSVITAPLASAVIQVERAQETNNRITLKCAT